MRKKKLQEIINQVFRYHYHDDSYELETTDHVMYVAGAIVIRTRGARIDGCRGAPAVTSRSRK